MQRLCLSFIMPQDDFSKNLVFPARYSTEERSTKKYGSSREVLALVVKKDMQLPCGRPPS